MHCAEAELRRDVGGREIRDLNTRNVRDRAAIFARAARLHELEARTRKESLGILLQPPFRGHRQHEGRAHASAPIPFSRSIHTAKPTAGIGAAAPRRVSNSS